MSRKYNKIYSLCIGDLGENVIFLEIIGKLYSPLGLMKCCCGNGGLLFYPHGVYSALTVGRAQPYMVPFYTLWATHLIPMETQALRGVAIVM